VEITRPADGVAYVAVTDSGDGDWEAAVPDASCPDAACPDAASPDAASPDVASPDAAWPEVDDLAEGGRGLALVAACSSRWGHERATGPRPGCTVWAEATWPVPVREGYLPRQAIWDDVDAPAAPGGGAA
jgi:hypothetical protein